MRWDFCSRVHIVAAAVAVFAQAAIAAEFEDAAARASLPEFKYIPAAAPHELTPAAPVSLEQFARWTRSQGDNGARRYSTLKQITKENVAGLEVAWTYRAGDGQANIQCTPIVVDGLLIAPTPGRAIVALDAATGVERWRMKPERGRDRVEDQPARRGLAHWAGDRSNAPRILFGAAEWIYAIDPKTPGKVAASRSAGHAFKRSALNGCPANRNSPLDSRQRACSEPADILTGALSSSSISASFSCTTFVRYCLDGSAAGRRG